MAGTVGEALVFELVNPFIYKISSSTHCYIHPNRNGTFSLYGNIEWKDDRYYGKYNSLDKALEVARKLNCKVQ